MVMLRDSLNFAVGDIVRIVNPTAITAKFCCGRNITGKIILIEKAVAEIDFGFYYNVFEYVKNIEMVASYDEIPTPEDA